MKAFGRPSVELLTQRLLCTYCLVLAAGVGCEQASTTSSVVAQTARTLPIVQIGHAHALIGYAFSPDGSRLFTADPQCVMVWDATTGAKIAVRPWTSQPLAKHSRVPISMFRFVNDGRQVVIGAELWDVASGRFVRSLLGATQAPFDLSISPDGQHVMYGMQNGEACVVDIRTGKRTAFLPRPSGDPSKIQFHESAVTFTEEGPQALVREGFDAARLRDVQTGKLLRRLELQHESGSISPDGRYSVTRHWGDTGSSVEEATIWDNRDGRKVVAFWEPIDDRKSIKFLPDGQHVVVGIDRKVAELWQLESGQKVHSFPGHLRRIASIQVARDGQTMVTRSCDAAIEWEIVSGEKLREFQHPESEQMATADGNRARVLELKSGFLVVPHPDRKTFLVSQGNRVRVLDAQSNNTIRKYELGLLRPSGSTIHDIEFSPTGETVLIRHQGGSYAVILREAETGRVLARVAQTPIPEGYLQLSPDGRFALTTPRFEPVRLWDTSNGRLLQMVGYAGDNRNCTSTQVSFSANGKYIFAHGGGNGGGIFFWETETGTPLHQQHRADLPANRQGLVLKRAEQNYYWGRSAAHPDGRQWACMYSQCEIEDPQRPGIHHVIIWDTNTATRLHDFLRPDYYPNGLRFSPDGSCLAICWYSHDHHSVHIEFRDTQSGDVLHTIEQQRKSNRPVTVHFVPGGNRVLINTRQRSLYLWDLDTKELVATLSDTRPIPHPGNPPHLLSELQFSATGRHVLADYDSKYVILWDLVNTVPAHLFEQRRGHTSMSGYFTFSLDGRRLLWWQGENNERKPTLWDLDEGCRQMPDTDLPTERYRKVVLDPSGYWRTAGHPATILLDALTGKRKISFPPSSAAYASPPCSISPDGTRAIGGRESDQDLCLWNLDSGQVVAAPLWPAAAKSRTAALQSTRKLGAIDWQQHCAVVLAHTWHTSLRQRRSFATDSAASFLDLKTGQLSATDLRHDDPTAKIFATLVLPESGDVVTVSHDGTAVRWSRTGRKLLTYRDIPWNGKSARFSDDLSRLIVHCDDGSFAQWDLKSGQPQGHSYLLHNASRWVTIAPDGKASGNLEYVK